MKLKTPISKSILFIFFTLLGSNLQAQDILGNKIAQMLMVGYYDDTPFVDSLYYDIEFRNLGGVIYFARNVESPSQISAQSISLQSAASIPLFTAVDQEGGFVARLDEQNGFTETKTAYMLGTVINSEDTTRAEAAIMAQWLKNSGININLAPVVDVNVNPESPAIGNYERSFSADPINVYWHSSWYIDEFSKLNIHSTLKHFPGHGSAEEDSHNGFTDVTDTWNESELQPYEHLINGGFNGLIMSAHIFNANLDDQYPASLSKKIISGLLRDSLGFNGLVISDELFMNAITDNYGFDESIVLAINAGTDILLFRRNYHEERSLVDYVIQLVKRKISEGEISESRIDESYNRIISYKNNISAVRNLNEDTLPDQIELSAYPNPFNISTNLAVTINKKSNVRIKVFDILGRSVYNENMGEMDPGSYTVHFNASGLSSGTYIAVLETEHNYKARKINLIK